MKKLDLRQLLNFYDYRVASSNTHASAINAVLGEDLALALMCHYFKERGWTVEALPGPCTTGKQRGHRLDKWIAVKSTDPVPRIFQVEIKNWSAHSIGGTIVPREATSEEMNEYRRDRWRRQFNSTDNNYTPSQKQTQKVLTPMLVPQSHRNHQHEALLCFWEALHPEGIDEPFFSVKVSNKKFDVLHVFSMSNYTRRLLKHSNTLEVIMPVVDARMQWLDLIYN